MGVTKPALKFCHYLSKPHPHFCLFAAKILILFPYNQCCNILFCLEEAEVEVFGSVYIGDEEEKKTSNKEEQKKDLNKEEESIEVIAFTASR